ncbi:MAG: hypothetical protein KQI62_09060 [Deltaproteobacteria bacterium]|nr:hypothetical protein [Deltaproteobacteria bacterium]
MAQVSYVVILWVHEAFRVALDDGENLPHTHAGFAKGLEKLEARVEGQGNVPVKVEVDVEEFLAWCRGNGRRPDAKGRLGFANVKARDNTLVHGGE